MARSCEFEPNTRSTTVPVHLSSPVVRSRPSSTAAVVAEFVASDNGLGFLLLEYNGALDTSMTFATIIVLSVLGLALYGAVELIEHLAIPWHISRRRDPAQVSAIRGANP